MNLGRLSINQPILAMVLSIVLLIVGAIATDQSRKIVFVVRDDDVVEARPVTLGALDDGLRVIKDGLKGDDKVIVDGLQRARIGAKVSPHPPASGGGKSGKS